MLRRTLVSLLVLLLALGLGWAAYERLFGFLDGPPADAPIELAPTAGDPAAPPDAGERAAGAPRDERSSQTEVAATDTEDRPDEAPPPPAAAGGAPEDDQPPAITEADGLSDRPIAAAAPTPEAHVPEIRAAPEHQAARTDQPQEPLPSPTIGRAPGETPVAAPPPPREDTAAARAPPVPEEPAEVEAQRGVTPADRPGPAEAPAAQPEIAAVSPAGPEIPAVALSPPEVVAEPGPVAAQPVAEPETAPEPPVEAARESAVADEQGAPSEEVPATESPRSVEQAGLDPAVPAAPEVDAEVAAGEPEAAPEWAPWSSLSLESIQRALSAMLGGASDPPEEAGLPEPAAGPPEPGAEPLEVARAEPQGPAPPQFDIVRIGPDGRAVIAGRAEPGTEVEVRSGEQVIDRVAAGRRGHWVATPGEPLKPGDHELTLVSWRAGERLLDSEEVVVVVVPEPPPPQPPPVASSEPPPPQPTPIAAAEPGEVLAVAVPRGGEGFGRILQAPGRISGDGTLALMIVDYDEHGMTRLTGEAPPGAAVRIYVDNHPAAEVIAQADGQWTIVLDERLQPGTYTLRLDQLDAQGRPVARLETPFTRVSQPPIAGDMQVDYVVVQPGNSLWRIARRLFGEGIQYVHIYDANQTQIRDPDLIYPGQVFEIPRGMSAAG